MFPRWMLVVPLLTAATAPMKVGPVDMARYGGHAYAFVDQMLTLEEAGAACAMLDSALAQIDTPEELWFVHDHLHSGARLNSSAWSWLGGSTLATGEGPLVLQYAWDHQVQTAFVRVHAEDRHKPICERVIR
jgi:hypothetical protein